MKRLRKIFQARAWTYGLFWSWNIIFLAFVLFGFAPQVLPELIKAVRIDDFPAAFLVYAVIMTAIPVAAVILGLIRLRRSPGRLFALGYGVEGPLMLIFLIRFFVVREMTPAVTFLLITAGLGLATFLWQILDRHIDGRGPLLAHLRVVGLTLLLLTGLYASLWLGFYAVPLAAYGLQGITEFLANLPEFLADLWQSLITFNWRDLLEIEWGFVPLVVLGTILGFYSATLLVLMPVAVLILYGRAWWQGLAALLATHSRRWAIAIVAAVVAICLTLFIQTNRQPQHRAFALLENPPVSPSEAQTLLDRQETIRAGLLNAYLASFRYFSATGEVRHISSLYRDSLDLPQERAERVQQVYEIVARPVLYSPVDPPERVGSRWDSQVMRQEPRRAAELYEAFFDEPILDGEREAVVHAARSTWSIDQAQVAWQLVDDREIHLNRQELTVTEQGDWADVELYEVYQNQTGQRQEVIYYFNLPESAVVTGLWLGDSPNPDDRFAYRVSPRGAAQATYRNEVRRNVDPALVEQIGPRQYRLRIFPVEPQNLRWEQDQDQSTIEAGPPLHMWLTWRVLAQDSGWPLPRLAEKRNVYWDDASIRLVNGEPMAVDEDSWLPTAVPAASPVEPMAHGVKFPGGDTVLTQPVTESDLPDLPAGLRLAVVLDRSRSMAEHAAEVKPALAELSRVVAAGGDIDLYLTASKYRGEEPSRVELAGFEPEDVIYFGGQNAAELLVQFDALRNSEEYEVILVLTDGSGYELTGDGIDVPRPESPVWMVHLGGDFPLGYDDGTLEAIQASGGGVAGSVTEALARLAIGLTQEAAGSTSDLVDGYLWSTVEAGTLTTTSGQELIDHPVSDDFAALAARRLILSRMERQRDNLDQLETLDQLHALAIEHSVVTPYSSMIVLVNREQERLLRQLENRGDRFQREYEEVGETTPENPFDVTGVPEPEEWLLLALAVGMLGWYVYRARQKPAATGSIGVRHLGAK